MSKFTIRALDKTYVIQSPQILKEIMIYMDVIDNKICEMLRHDSRTSFVDIAKRLGVSEGTIRNRVKKLTDSSIIERFTIKCRHAAEGIVLIKSRKSDLKGIAIELKQLSNDIFELTGEYDIACMINAESFEELNKKIDRIRTIKGVSSTTTAIKLR